MPENIALIADDSGNYPIFENELTVINNTFAQKAAAAIDMFHHILEGSKDRSNHYQVIIEPELIICSTCGARIKNKLL